ncbi:DUF2065 domain-containing protein [Celeribacter indicus]|uniref:DUF2065 domain-containing protein n=1 Tax=Celeribacter indicus TaxID=1208324 RepID=A0A0B5E7F9_9RHOB|nr:DUF2065 domain-containing protein [Celeribacter indicus]AJE48217.1 hypothetical protein P73_3502 [Celeribacter indicus]SDW69752.1 hypothetical protein SAMN05443573_10645 [Celeribacter indicus]
MGFLILAIGLVLCVEGLALALAPSRMEDLVRAVAALPPARRRVLGLAALALGVVLIALARGFVGLPL